MFFVCSQSLWLILEHNSVKPCELTRWDLRMIPFSRIQYTQTELRSFCADFQHRYDEDAFSKHNWIRFKFRSGISTTVRTLRTAH